MMEAQHNLVIIVQLQRRGQKLSPEENQDAILLHIRHNATHNARRGRPSTISQPTLAASTDLQIRERDAHQYLADIEALALAEAPERGYARYCMEALRRGLQKGLAMLWCWDWSQYYLGRVWDYYNSGVRRCFAAGESLIFVPEGWVKSEAWGKPRANERTRIKGCAAGESVLGTGEENSNEQITGSDVHKQLAHLNIDTQLVIRGCAARVAANPSGDNAQKDNSPIINAEDIQICIPPNEHLHSYITRAIDLQSSGIYELKSCALETAPQHFYPYRQQMALYIQLFDIGLLDEGGNLEFGTTFGDVGVAVDRLLTPRVGRENVNEYASRCKHLEAELEEDDHLWFLLGWLPGRVLNGLRYEAVQFGAQLYLKIDGYLDGALVRQDKGGGDRKW